MNIETSTKLMISPSNCKKIWKKLGITEDDFVISKKLIAQIPPPPPPMKVSCRTSEIRFNKVEILMGYSIVRLRREKALRFFGVTEKDVNTENAKNLGSLGNGRRRSFKVSRKKWTNLIIPDKHDFKSRRTTDGVKWRKITKNEAGRRISTGGISNSYL